ncbi:hypothetical protein AOZ06_13190 [Kibdelosporangium phytohabitans]|uniref:Alginate lyase domain-containing protein n=2 Tax=Kibdelosporangium phytohabitans TaxID=860235 RepID=A0A0N9IHC4_9PSEU|nr:hypothetical protein AOZ06_12870 [Kibdelosporangium phytohabitans]ALG14758.1 hypothetical protein AOZ06_13190 [Kibdelosporangium phytohabitans]
MTPEQRSLRARIAAHASWATTSDRGEKARKGAAALLERFERQVDPDGVLPAEERRQRALSARKAHMLSLAAKSATARRRGA